eukprot:2089292-Prymnesium_polylepis.2
MSSSPPVGTFFQRASIASMWASPSSSAARLALAAAWMIDTSRSESASSFCSCRRLTRSDVPSACVAATAAMTAACLASSASRVSFSISAVCSSDQWSATCFAVFSTALARTTCAHAAHRAEGRAHTRGSERERAARACVRWFCSGVWRCGDGGACDMRGM